MASVEAQKLTLAHLGRFIGALAAGALPTQTQLSAIIDALVQCPLLQSTPDVLSTEGRELVDASREVLLALKDVSDTKNADDNFQRLFHMTARAEKTVEANAPSQAGPSDLSPSADLSALLDAVRTTLILFATSPTARRLLGEAGALLFDLFAQVRQEVEAVVAESAAQESIGDAKNVLAQGAASAPKRAQQWADEHFPHEPEDALIERLQELVGEIRRDDRFVAAADTVVHILEHYVTAVHEAIDTTAEAIKEDERALKDAGRAALDCAAAFLGKERIERMLDHAKRAIDECAKDEQLRKAANELSRLFKRLLHDPKYVTSQRFGRRFRALRRNVTNALSRKSSDLRDALGHLQSDLQNGWGEVMSDPAVQRLSSAGERWAHCFPPASSLLKGPAALGRNFVQDVARYWMPKLLEMLLLVAIPRIEFVSPEWDVAVDGFAIRPPDSGFGPSVLRFANLSEAALRRPRPQSPRLDAALHADTVFEMRGVRGVAREVSIYIRRKQGWVRLEEEAVLDLVLGFHELDGLNVHVETSVLGGDVADETRWEVKKAEVRLEGLSIYARSAEHHPVLSRLILPRIEFIVRRQVEIRLEALLLGGISQIESSVSALTRQVNAAQAEGRSMSWGDWVALLLGRLGRREETKEQEQEQESAEGPRASIDASRAGIVRTPAEGGTQLAIGFDAQLLPGKATPLSRRKANLREEIRRDVSRAEANLQRTVEGVTATAGAAAEAVQEGQRVHHALREHGEGPVRRWADDRWRSKAFDL